MTNRPVNDKLISFRVLGHEFPLRVSPEDEAFMRNVVGIVSERISSVRQSLQREPDLTVAVVAAISIAEELCQLRQTGSPMDDLIIKEIEKLDQQLASCLSDNGSDTKR